MTEPERFELLPPLDDRPGPARKLGEARAAELVRGALDAVLLDAAADPRDDATAVDLIAQASAMNAAPALAGRPVATARRPSRGRFVLVACLGILVAGIASAAIYRVVQHLRPPATSPSTSTSTSPSTSPSTSTSTSPSTSTSTSPVVIASPEPTASAAPADVTDTGPDTAPDTIVIDEPSPSPGAPAPSSRPRASASPSARPAPAAVAAAEDALRAANARRSARAWADADRLYQSIVVDHPGTDAAYVATVAAAALRLDHLSDARGALRLYRAALRSRPRGALSEEALLGVADAQHRLNDAGEADTLASFLERFPDSPEASRARARLAKLRP